MKSFANFSNVLFSIFRKIMLSPILKSKKVDNRLPATSLTSISYKLSTQVTAKTER